MKKFCILVLLCVSAPVFSSRADIIYPDGSKPWIEPYTVKKLSRGFLNTTTFVFEIPKTIFEITQENGVLSMGQSLDSLIRGPYKAMLRLSSGLYDLGTAFEHDKPLLHLEPEILDIIGDIMPGYNYQFHWQTIDTPAAR